MDAKTFTANCDELDILNVLAFDADYGAGFGESVVERLTAKELAVSWTEYRASRSDHNGFRGSELDIQVFVGAVEVVVRCYADHLTKTTRIGVYDTRNRFTTAGSAARAARAAFGVS